MLLQFQHLYPDLSCCVLFIWLNLLLNHWPLEWSAFMGVWPDVVCACCVVCDIWTLFLRFCSFVEMVIAPWSVFGWSLSIFIFKPSSVRPSTKISINWRSTISPPWLWYASSARDSILSAYTWIFAPTFCLTDLSRERAICASVTSENLTASWAFNCAQVPSGLAIINLLIKPLTAPKADWNAITFFLASPQPQPVSILYIV